MLSKQTTILIAVLTGVALEWGIHALSGRREAWDSVEYWTLGLPAALAVSLVLGYLSQRTDWLRSLIVAPSQVATMMVRGGEIGNLWPLTRAASAILSTPFVLAAFVGSRFRRTS